MLPLCGDNRNMTTNIHKYNGSGSWMNVPVRQMLHLHGSDVICDDGDDIPGVWHAQNGQDRRVVHILGKRRGFFVDLAANKPVTLSNTRALERDFGWRGLCIEGHIGLLPELAMRRSCSVIEAMVSAETDQEVTFRRFVGKWKQTELHAMSGIVGKGMGNGINKTCWGKGAAESTGWPCIKIDKYSAFKHDEGLTTTLASILDYMQAPRTIDYLSLDVEGAEQAVLRQFPFHRYDFRLISIERPSFELATLMMKNFYRYVCDNGSFGDELWVHERELSSLPKDLAALHKPRSTHPRCPPMIMHTRPSV